MKRILLAATALALLTAPARAENPDCTWVLKAGSTAYNSLHVSLDELQSALAKVKGNRPAELGILGQIEEWKIKLANNRDMYLQTGFTVCKDFEKFKADFDAAINPKRTSGVRLDADGRAHFD